MWLCKWRLLGVIWILLLLSLCFTLEPAVGARARSPVRRTRRPRTTTTTTTTGAPKTKARPTNPTIPPQILRTHEEIVAAMMKSEIIPDLFAQAPKNLQPVLVRFERNSTADLGNHLYIRDLEYWAPLIQWKANETDYHTLMMLNLDVPTREKPWQREWIVWLMVNIPGCWVMRGDQIIEYEEPDPEEGTGAHRYVVLIYYQKNGKQKFREYAFNLIPSMLPQECRRQKFQSRLFAADYGLDEPIGLNFWTTQWEEKIKKIPTLNYDYYQE